MKKFLISIAATICGFSVLATAQTETQRIAEKFDKDGAFENGVWGMLAVRGQKDTLVDIHRNIRMAPASNTKLLTTGIALKLLGPDWRYRTGLAYDGEIIDGVLEGNLYVVGSGDPTTAADYKGVSPIDDTFKAWKTVLDNAGIKKITGCIVGDGRYFDGKKIPASWEYEDLGTDYGCTAEALNFYENVQKFTITGGGKPGDLVLSIKTTYPSSPWLSVSSNARFIEGRSNHLTFHSCEWLPYATFNGTLGIERKEVRESVNNCFGAYTCAFEFSSYLNLNGLPNGGYADVGPSGNIRSNLYAPFEGEKAATEPTVIGYSESQPLIEILGDCNRVSDNFYAEALLRTVGKELTGSASYDGCIEARDSMFCLLGLQGNEGCRVVDGSGLSSQNWVSPEFFVKFLTAMQNSEVGDTYVNMLAGPGKGTMTSMLKTCPESLRSRIHIKSGTITGAKNYSGYILGASGKAEDTIVFSLLTNHMTASVKDIQNQLETLIASLAKENAQ